MATNSSSSLSWDDFTTFRVVVAANGIVDVYSLAEKGASIWEILKGTTVLPETIQVWFNFSHDQVFPEKIVKNWLSEELSDISTVSLRGPSGQTWIVKLMINGSDDDEILYLEKGWEKFVKDHSLKENDILFLKYKLGGSVFDVLVFDDENFCEKESSYFVRNCKNDEACHRSNGWLNERKRVEIEPSMEIIEPQRLCYKAKQINISDDEEEDSCRLAVKHHDYLLMLSAKSLPTVGCLLTTDGTPGY